MGKKDILAIRYECETMLLILKEANDADVRSEIICKRTESRKVSEREDSEWMIRGEKSYIYIVFQRCDGFKYELYCT